MARVANFYGSVYQGFSRLGKFYDAGQAVTKFNPYFWKLFLNGGITRNYNGNVIDLASKLIRRRTADYSLTREEIPNPVLPQSETIESLTLPDIKERIIITQDMLENRMAKQPYYAKEEIESAKLVQEKVAEQIEAIERRNEKSSIELLLTGTITNKEKKEIISVPNIASHIVTPSKTWEQADAKPMDDLENLCALLFKDGGVNDFDVYMGQQAFVSFINNESVQKDLKVLTIGNVNPLIVGQTPNPVGISSWSSFMTKRQNTITIKQYNQLEDTFDESGNRTGSNPLFDPKVVLIIAKYAPLQAGIGRPLVMKPMENANYKYQESGEYIFTMESTKSHIEIMTWFCGSPLLNYMDRVGTIKAVA